MGAVGTIKNALHMNNISFGPMTLLGDIVMPGMELHNSLKSGDNIAVAAGKVLATEMFYSSPLGMPSMFIQAGAMGAKAALDIGKQTAGVSQGQYGARFGSDSYQMTTNAATLRQRGLQAIQNSNGNVRSVLGNEARSYHRNNMYR